MNQSELLFDIPSVSELTTSIKQMLEGSFVDILVEGEASNVKFSTNGHIYFTLKDDGAQLPCVMWKSDASRFRSHIKEGAQLVIGGDIQVYAPHGKYQMVCHFVQKAGIGKLQLAFEELKERLQAEGLFEHAHKKRIPKIPLKIGVVTSQTGAAFQDIRSTLEKRWPMAEVLLYHASVQGDAAAGEIVKGIQWFDETKSADVLIIGRGGGSLEDLWAFNEEPVARAIFNCSIPIISAVGHETDFSISDFVADQRAATPTQAAVMAAPNADDVRQFQAGMSERLEYNINRIIERTREKIDRLSKTHALLAVKNRIENTRNIVALQANKLERLLRQKLDLLSIRFSGLNSRLSLMNPSAPLEKGFTRIVQENMWIKNAEDFNINKAFDIEWKDGKKQIH